MKEDWELRDGSGDLALKFMDLWQEHEDTTMLRFTLGFFLLGCGLCLSVLSPLLAYLFVSLAMYLFIGDKRIE